MALHSELPIYKVAYDLLSHVVQISRNMPREFKQSIGGTLRDDHDRARLANELRRRGHCVDRDLTKIYRRPA